MDPLLDVAVDDAVQRLLESRLRLNVPELLAFAPCVLETRAGDTPHALFLALAGLSTEAWTPQFNYWRRPEALDDGGQNILE